MYLRKTIVLVALAAATAAPSAGAMLAPVEPGLIVLQGTTGRVHPKAKPHRQCTHYGPPCFTATY